MGKKKIFKSFVLSRSFREVVSKEEVKAQVVIYQETKRNLPGFVSSLLPNSSSQKVERRGTMVWFQ